MLSLRPSSLVRPLARALCSLVAVGSLSLAAACSDSTASSTTPSDPIAETYSASLGVNISTMTKKSANLYYQDLTVGTGSEAVSGRSLSMVYTGWLVNGMKFDSNVGGNLFAFVLGAGQVITGWDQGLLGMKVGGKRRLVIGSTLGYGGQGAGTIPPNARWCLTWS